jgi:DNA-binding SARP family transcriptional activator
VPAVLAWPANVPALEFRILGSLEVRGDAGPLDLGPAKQRALLAILLLHPNEVLSTDRLVEELWTQPPATAANTLQVYVGRLRKALEPDRPRGAPGSVLSTRAPGYAINLESGQLDSERFQTLADDGRRAREAGENELARERLREALGLWRGPALAEFTYDPFAQVEIARLEELRIDALEEWFDAELALGRHVELVADLERHVAEHPLRERPRGQLMVALYRSERQVEALRVYREARHTLVEELGIEPSPSLRRLEAAILNQEPALEWPASVRSAGELAAAAGEAPSGSKGRGTRKTVTVLVAGAMGGATLDPEALAGWGERLRDAASHAAMGCGGEVTDARGDEVTIVFGVPRVHEDDARRAVDAAVRIRGALGAEPEAESHADAPALAIGVATGEVLAEHGRDASIVVGDAVSFAQRLQAGAQGEIVLAEDTYRVLSGQARADPVEVASTRAWRLVELDPEPKPLALRSPSGIVGRAAELHRVQQAMEWATEERAAYLLSIVGPPGIGKSRLIAEFTASPPAGPRVLAGRCVAYGEGITFRPLREIVEQLGGRASLPRLLAEEDDGALVAERLAEVARSGASPSTEEVFWATATLFGTLARHAPLVAVFEDVHWAEPTFLDLITYLHGAVRDGPLLLVCLARPELLEQRPEWGAKGSKSGILLLGPLSEPESRALAHKLVPGARGAIRDRVVEVAEGNPLFIEQLAASIAEIDEGAGQVAVPPTIQALLAARLDRLGPGERAVGARAAIIGRDFDPEGAFALLPGDARPFAERHLGSLIEKGLVERITMPTGRERLRFGHALIQQAAYRAIPKQLRSELHESFANWLESEEGPDTEFAQSEIVGYHLEQAFTYRDELGQVGEEDRELGRRAAELLDRAGRRTFRQGDMPAAANLLERAASLRRATGGKPLELLPDLAYALFEIGELDRANAVLTAAESSARDEGNVGLEWGALAKRLHVQLYTDPVHAEFEQLIATAREAIERLGEVGDHAGLSRAQILLSEVLYTTGEVVAATAAARQAAEHARRYGSRREEAWALGHTAFCIIYGPTPVESGLDWLKGLLAGAPGNPVLEANMLPFLASLEAMAGRVDEAREHVARGRALIRDLGLMWQAGIHDWFSGEIEMLSGDPITAERDYLAARAACEAIDDAWFLSLVAASLPASVFAQGRYEDAWELTAAVEESPSASGDLEWEIRRRGVRAKLLARREQPERGEALAREAVRLAASSDFLGLHADALLDLAEILRQKGPTDEASAAVEEAAQLFERKGNVVSARRARKLITQAV